MNIDAILSAIDSEIGRLQAARALLLGTESSAASTKKSVGRPKKVTATVPAAKVKKRTMSAEGKARIAAAQKRRWADMKRATK